MNHETLQLYHRLQQAERTPPVLQLINEVNNDLRKEVLLLATQIIAIAEVTGYDAMRAGIELMEQAMKS